MKLKYLAAFLMLFAIGCTQQPSTPAAGSGDTGSDSTAASTVEPETETTQVASTTTVKLDVTGMS